MTDSIHDIRTLARLASDGDLTALGPLLDALKEAGDWRALELHKLIGWLASGHRASRRMMCKFRRRLWELFWPELSDVGALEMLRDRDEEFRRLRDAPTPDTAGEDWPEQAMGDGDEMPLPAGQEISDTNRIHELLEEFRQAREEAARRAAASESNRWGHRDSSAPRWVLRKTPSSNREG